MAVVPLIRATAQLDNLYDAIKVVDIDIEMQSRFAKYLCIRTSGYLENGIYEIFMQYARVRCDQSVLQFVDSKLARVQNLKVKRICELAGDFDARFRSELEAYLVDKKKESINSVVGLRNNIAHGGSATVTYARMKDYYTEVKAVMIKIANLLEV